MIDAMETEIEAHCGARVLTGRLKVLLGLRDLQCTANLSSEEIRNFASRRPVLGF